MSTRSITSVKAENSSSWKVLTIDLQLQGDSFMQDAELQGMSQRSGRPQKELLVPQDT